MRDVLRNFLLMLLAILALIALGALARPGNQQMASSLELIARPDAVLQLEAQRQRAALAVAQVQAQSDAARADAMTTRLGLVLIAIVVLAIVGAVVVTLRDTRRRVTVHVLLPNTPGFYAALRAQGGNFGSDGVPRIEGRAVAQLEVIEMERRK